MGSMHYWIDGPRVGCNKNTNYYSTVEAEAFGDASLNVYAGTGTVRPVNMSEI